MIEYHYGTVAAICSAQAVSLGAGGLVFQTMIWNTYVIHLRALVGPNHLHKCPKLLFKGPNMSCAKRPLSLFCVLFH